MRKISISVLALLYGLMTASHAYALQGTANGNLGVEFTDNATLAASNEVDDQIVTAQVGGSLVKSTGAATGDANFSVRHEEYLNDTFAKRNYLKLGTAFNWAAVRDRIVFDVNDYFTQTAIDNLAANVPSNRENANAFALSAGISFPIANRHSLSVSPSFRDFWYDKSDADNQQFGLSAAWAYQFKPTVQVSVSGSKTQVEYDSNLNTDYDSENISMVVSGTTARMSYSASLGKTWVDSAALADNDGLSASLSVNFNVSGRSTLRAVLLQDITNTSSLFLGTAIDPATGNIINIQTSGEVVRNRSMRVKYARKGTMINTDIWTELRELDYSSATSDRDVQEVGASLGYPVTPLMNASLSGRYTRNDLQATAVVQKEFSVAAGLGYQFSRRVGLNFAVKHNSRNSTVAADEFDEFSVSANVGYKFWP